MPLADIKEREFKDKDHLQTTVKGWNIFVTKIKTRDYLVTILCLYDGSLDSHILLDQFRANNMLDIRGRTADAIKQCKLTAKKVVTLALERNMGVATLEELLAV